MDIVSVALFSALLSGAGLAAQTCLSLKTAPAVHLGTETEILQKLQPADWKQLCEMGRGIMRGRGYMLHGKPASSPETLLDFIAEDPQEGLPFPVRCVPVSAGPVSAQDLAAFDAALRAKGYTRGMIMALPGLSADGRANMKRHSIAIMFPQQVASFMDMMRPGDKAAASRIFASHTA